MALVINRTLRDGDSTASFEVVNDSGGEAGTIIDVSALSGAGTLDNHQIIITRVVATVARGVLGGGHFVTLSWGGVVPFLHIPVGVTDIDIPFRTPNAAGGGAADVTLVASANTLFSLRIFTNKMIGYPLSMGHSAHRP